MAGLRGRAIQALIAAAGFFLATAPASAHASDRGHVLLLPTGYYMAGGAAAVAASFLALAVLPPRWTGQLWARRLQLPWFGEGAKTIVSLVSFAGFVVLVASGLFGSRDPLSNPLPLVVWTVMWIGLVVLQGVVGDLWSWLNPWYGPWRIARDLFGMRGDASLFRLPSWLGCWPAFLLFLAFTWFELIDPAPDDPLRLAKAATVYWLATFVGMVVFGYGQWSRRGEFLSLFMGMMARLSVFGVQGGRLRLGWPGWKLLGAEPLPASGTAFLLFALSSVSFDGLCKTFFWLGLFGINPLEYPGRTALVDIASFGLALSFLGLAGIFLAAIDLGHRLAGGPGSTGQVAGLLVWSIVPIASAYHFAHYLTALLVDGQYALAAISDPFARGWNLFGTADMTISAGVVAGAESAWWLWNGQAASIVAGHVLAVLIAHGLAWQIHGDARKAVLSQLPLTVLMIAYTVLGLWLLATPTAG